MRAQSLYNWRECTGYIDGNDLSELFRFLFRGEASPRGKRRVPYSKLTHLAFRHPDTIIGDAALEFLLSWKGW